jgi:putative ABC transport system permease protein
MSLWRHLVYGLRNLKNRRQQDQDVADEVEQYIEEAARELQAQGLSKEEARRAARREAGNLTVVKEQVASYGWETAARNLLADLRFAFRQLRKQPLFTLSATLTLALGIGANTAIFTVVQSVLLAPLPFADASQLADVETHWTDSGRTVFKVTGPDAADIRQQAHSLAAVSLYSGGTLGVQLADHSVYTVVSLVDADFARVFNLQPVAGSLFTDSDAHHAALVRETFAREHFGGAQAAVGKTIRVESEVLQIAGVLPASFNFPARTQVWEAMPLKPESTSRTAFNYHAVARLQPGTSFERTRTELETLSQRLEKAYPEDNRKKQLTVQPLQQAMTQEARPTLLFLWGTAGFILLIACVNVTHLQLVRSTDRQRELAIRRALGSSRWQIMQPVILESLLLSLLGSALGILSAWPAVHALVAMAPKEVPRSTEVHLNAWVLGFSLLLAVFTSLTSSIVPALRAAKVDPAEALKSDNRGTPRQGTTRLRDGLVMAEVAATFVLVLSAGLLLHTMLALLERDMGYETKRLLIIDADAPAHTLAESQRAVDQFNQIFARSRTLPGTEHVAGVMGLPTGNYGSNGYYQTKGGLPIDPHHLPYSNFTVASPRYFATMGIPLKRGRDFNDGDTFTSPFVAIVSEALARQSFGDADPVGKQIQCGLDSDQWMTIIGVTGDVRQDSPAESPGPALYVPMTQHPYHSNQIHIVLRTAVKPLGLMHPVEQIISQVNPLIAMKFTTMGDMMNESMEAERFRAVLISCFAGVGLLLAMLGVYGTMAYAVAQRTFEIGIRIALGAERRSILATVLGHAAKLAVFGIAAGLVVSLLLARLMTSMLVGVKANDPVSIAAAAFLLITAALVAALVPGWRATHVDPMAALRAE